MRNPVIIAFLLASSAFLPASSAANADTPAEIAAFSCGATIASRTLVDVLPKTQENEAMLKQMARGTEECLKLYPGTSKKLIETLMN